MKISEQKKVILKVLKPFFKEENIKGVNVWELEYAFSINQKKSSLRCSLSFSNFGLPIGFGYGLCIYDVEKIIMEIEFPSHDFKGIQKNEFPLETIIGGGFTKLYIDDLKYQKKLDSVESYTNFGEEIILFLKTDGQKFIETYSYLPNVLKKMDELTAQGKTWQDKGRGILSGALDAQFRGLIISKLCNDNGFDKKINMCDEIFSREQYKAWLPYYEKLKERLKSVEPKYNI